MMRAFPTSVRSTQLDKEAGMEDSLRKKKERGVGRVWDGIWNVQLREEI